MINKNDVKNIVVCKCADGNEVIHIHTNSGHIYTLEESGKDANALYSEVLGPKVQEILDNDQTYQNKISILEAAKSIAAEDYDVSYITETDRLKKKLEAKARKSALESLINKDTIYIVTPEEYVKNITNFQRKSKFALDRENQPENENSYSHGTGKNYENFIRENIEKMDQERAKTKTKKRETSSPVGDENPSEETDRRTSSTDSSSTTDSFEHGFGRYATPDESYFTGRTLNPEDNEETHKDENDSYDDEEDMHSEDEYRTHSNDDESENNSPKKKVKTSDFVGGRFNPENYFGRTEDDEEDTYESSEASHSTPDDSSEETERDSERTYPRGRFTSFESEDDQRPIEEDAYEEDYDDEDEDEDDMQPIRPKRKASDFAHFTGRTINPEDSEETHDDDESETYEDELGTHEDEGSDFIRRPYNPEVNEETHSNSESSEESTSEGTESEGEETSDDDLDLSEYDFEPTGTDDEDDFGDDEDYEDDENEDEEEDTHSNTETASDETSDESNPEETESDGVETPDDDLDLSEYDFEPTGTDDEDDFDLDNDNENEDESDNSEENENNETHERQGFIKRLFNKIRRSPIGAKIAAIAVSVAMIFGISAGLHSCSKHRTLEGRMNNSNIESMTNLDETESNIDGIIITGDNSTYNNLTVQQLLDVTTNKAQKDSMSNLHTSIIGFNQTFADAHAGSYQNEAGETINVRAALSFDEMVALQQAYNDYSKTELKAYFNGADIDKDTITRAYKDASLQLMGAYVIETSENPVDMSGLINTDEGKEFYNRYHQMFLAAKQATGDDKLEKIKAFYTAVKQDFPITQEVRTEGIAHADDYASLASYKLSVAPMIAAGEMMWQNYEVDETLDDSTIDFLNDLGLCNYAESKFEKIEMISLSSESDSTNPLYDQYKEAFEKELKEQNIYVIDDEHRELSKLQEFQDAVNWHFENTEGYGYTSVVEMTTSETYQETSSYQTSSTSYTTEQTREQVDESEVPESVREELKSEVDSEIASENEQAKQEAEKEAEETRKEMQSEEDKKAEEIKEEVKKDDEKLQDQIDQANDTINDNNKDQDPSNDNKVNESDFDGNVDFDDDHSDENGNLDDSVKDITTDGTGNQTGEELPDPNQTGAEFDNNAPSEDTSSSTNTSEETPSTSTDGSSDDVFEYEEVIDEYLNQMESQSQTETEELQYVK